MRRLGDPRRAWRVAALGSALTVVVASMFACGPEEKTPTFSLSLEATPLPPVPGEPVAFRLAGNGVGLVEIYQGADVVHVAVNPFELAPAGFYAFVARSAEVPRAVGYGQEGTRVEAEARPLVGAAPRPVAPVDAGPDAPPPGIEADACPASEELASDAGAICGAPGGLFVTLRVRNLRQNPIRVERTAQPPNQCTWENLGPVAVGETASFGAFDQSILRFIDAQGDVVVRQVRLTFGGACDLVVR